MKSLFKTITIGIIATGVSTCATILLNRLFSSKEERERHKEVDESFSDYYEGISSYLKNRK